MNNSSLNMNKPFIKRKSTESVEQIKFVQHVRTFHPDVLVFSVPNGGDVSASQRIRLTQEGMLAGVPDVLLFALHLPTLAIEFKRPDGKGKISPEQIAVGLQLEGVGAVLKIATSADQAKQYMAEWLAGV
jgi:hypothetical protein